METISYLLDFVLHLVDHLDAFLREYGAGTYGLLAAIIFVETGVVFMPFLPGDSLLFAAGALAGRDGSPLSPHFLFVLLAAAAFTGDQTNYWIGKLLGPHLVRDGNSRWLKKKHLDRTHAFFEKYGGKTIILARFVPIVRTFAPFVAGIGAMTYRRFVLFDLCGAMIWVGVCVYSGYAFGQYEFVKKRFELVVVAIIFISLLPGIIEFLKVRSEIRRERAAAAGRSAEDAT